MEEIGDLSDKTHILAVAYQHINDEGRDVLDKVVQKLEEINGKPEKIKDISFLASLKTNYDIC
jgi:hypothetical protein